MIILAQDCSGLEMILKPPADIFTPFLKEFHRQLGPKMLKLVFGNSVERSWKLFCRFQGYGSFLTE